MRKYFEISFDVVYLLIILSCGLFLVGAAHGRPLAGLFGAMALVLGGGDLFHLVPRIHMQAAGGKPSAYLGLGKWVTSITSTVYYLLLYHALLLIRPAPASALWTAVLYGLALLRIGLCCLPQNRWTHPEAPLRWGILRNLPFLAMGAVIVVLSQALPGPYFQHLSTAVLLSFGFYLPVVLLGGKYPVVGMLMIPKTIVYVWIQWMGLTAVLSGFGG